MAEMMTDTTSDEQSNNVEKEVLAVLISASAANYRQLSVQHKPVYRLHGCGLGRPVHRIFPSPFSWELHRHCQVRFLQARSLELVMQDSFKFWAARASLCAMRSRTLGYLLALHKQRPLRRSTQNRSLELVVHPLIMPHVRSLGQASCR